MEKMAKKEIIRQLEITKECDVDTVAQIKAINEAIYFLRNYFVDSNRIHPLTPEQLREMDGKPVWVEFEDGSGGLWGIVHISVFEQIVFPDGLHCTIGHPYYGKIYKAYAYHPANIDLEDWIAEWVEDGKCDHKPYRVLDAEKWKKYKCSKCGYKAGRRTSQKYCQSCGRAMTPEARDELKKRIR